MDNKIRNLLFSSWMVFFVIIFWKEGFRPFQPEVGVIQTGYAPMHPDDEM